MANKSKKPQAWTKANWLIDLKMNGPEPIKVVYVVKNKKKKTQSQVRDEYFNRMSKIA